jgi:hypothetical protein
VLEQFQQLEQVGLAAPALAGPPGIVVDENSAGVNFELVEWLAEHEERDWTYFGWLRHDRKKRLRDLQDVLIEVDRLRQQLNKRQAHRRGTPQR